MMTYLFTKTPLMFFVQSFWRDEAFSYLLANQGILNILQMTAKDFNPPLYYLLLHFWIIPFGSSEIALRSLSLIFFGLTVYIAYDILTEIGKIGKIRSLFYLVFIIFNPLLVYYAFEARMYSMITFFAALSFYAFYLKKKRLYIFAAICGLYTHYFMIFALAAQGIWSFLYRKPHEKLTDLIKPFIIPLLSLVPWVLFTFTQKRFDGEGFWIQKPILKDILYLPSVLYTGFEKDFAKVNHGKEDYTSLMTKVLMVILAIIFAYLVKRIVYEKKYRSLPDVGAYLLLWGLIPPLIIIISSFFFTPTYLPRYMAFASVGLILFLIYALEQLDLRIRIVLIALLFFVTNSYQKWNYVYREKSDFKLKAYTIQSLMDEDDQIFVSDERDFHTSRYYFRRDDIYIYGKAYKDIPAYTGKVLIPEENVKSMLPFYPKKAFVIRHNNGYDVMSQM